MEKKLPKVAKSRSKYRSSSKKHKIPSLLEKLSSISAMEDKTISHDSNLPEIEVDHLKDIRTISKRNNSILSKTVDIAKDQNSVLKLIYKKLIDLEINLAGNEGGFPDILAGGRRNSASGRGNRGGRTPTPRTASPSNIPRASRVEPTISADGPSRPTLRAENRLGAPPRANNPMSRIEGHFGPSQRSPTVADRLLRPSAPLQSRPEPVAPRQSIPSPAQVRPPMEERGPPPAARASPAPQTTPPVTRPPAAPATPEPMARPVTPQAPAGTLPARPVAASQIFDSYQSARQAGGGYYTARNGTIQVAIQTERGFVTRFADRETRQHIETLFDAARNNTPGPPVITPAAPAAAASQTIDAIPTPRNTPLTAAAGRLTGNLSGIAATQNASNIMARVGSASLGVLSRVGSLINPLTSNPVIAGAQIAATMVSEAGRGSGISDRSAEEELLLDKINANQKYYDETLKNYRQYLEIAEDPELKNGNEIDRKIAQSAKDTISRYDAIIGPMISERQRYNLLLDERRGYIRSHTRDEDAVKMYVPDELYKKIITPNHLLQELKTASQRQDEEDERQIRERTIIMMNPAPQVITPRQSRARDIPIYARIMGRMGW